MKRYFSLIVGCLVALLAVSAAAQTTQIATLLSGEDVRIFYGPESLKQAVTAAQDGDVITLSAGLFDAPSAINKSLTIRGAGIDLPDYKQSSAPTVISGSITIDSNSKFESIRFINKVSLTTLSTVTVSFERVRIEELISGASMNHNISVLHSYIQKNTFSVATVTALNSVLRNCTTGGNSSFHGTFSNCYLSIISGGQCFYNSLFINCTLRSYNGAYLSEKTQLINCIGTTNNTKSFFSSAVGHETCLELKNVNFFKEGTFYELLDEYKSFATSDGKEVGIYGGNLGFDITPSNPQITRFNVAPKTSVDGKLSIEIEVQGIE